MGVESRNILKLEEVEKEEVEEVKFPDFCLEDGPEKVFEGFRDAVEDSIILGRETTEYLKSLFQMSLKIPEKEYEEKITFKSYFMKNLEMKPHKAENYWGMFGVDRMKEYIKDQYQEDEGKLDVAIGNNDNRAEKFSRIFKRENEQVLVSEMVSNSLFDKINVCRSEIGLIDRKSGKFFDLQELLPENSSFRPDVMYQYDLFIDSESGDLKKKIIPVSLEEYVEKVEDKLDSDIFSANSREDGSESFVKYGDLEDDGQIMVLFHEIVHLWQNKYYERYGRYPFEDFFRTVTSHLENLTEYKEILEKRLSNSKPTLRVEELINREMDILNGLDIEFDYYTFNKYKGLDELSDDEFALHSELYEESFVIKKSKTMAKYIKDYQDQERGAWSMALKILRFLRNKGFDVEPGIVPAKRSDEELGNISVSELNKGVKNVVNKSLNTYQVSVESAVKSKYVVSKNDKKARNMDIRFDK